MYLLLLHPPLIRAQSILTFLPTSRIIVSSALTPTYPPHPQREKSVRSLTLSSQSGQRPLGEEAAHVEEEVVRGAGTRAGGDADVGAGVDAPHALVFTTMNSGMTSASSSSSRAPAPRVGRRLGFMLWRMLASMVSGARAARIRSAMLVGEDAGLPSAGLGPFAIGLGVGTKAVLAMPHCPIILSAPRSSNLCSSVFFSLMPPFPS